MNKLSIHILTTWKHKDRQESILSTWLKGIADYSFYTDRDTGIGNQNVVSDNDTYFSNGIKNLCELIRIYNSKIYSNFDWFYFCDDDTVPNLKLLNSKLNQLDKDTCYGHILNTYPQDPELHYFSGGAGYLVPARIIEKYGVPDLSYLNKSFYSDVCVGMWIRDKNINKSHIDELRSQPPEYYNISDFDIRNYLSFHYIKTHEAREKITNLFKL